MTAPPIDAIDALLAAWEERLRRMDENLVALEGEATYQILAGKAGARPALDGISRDRVYPALDAVTELFEHRSRLAGVIARARSVRASISPLTFWETDEKIASIDALLRGPSIDLGPKVTPLAERSLLDVSHHDVKVTPEELLASMVRAFEEARTVILAVSRAWESLVPAVDRIERRAADLRALAARLPPVDRGPFVATEPREKTEIAEVERDLAALRARVQRDPLGAEGHRAALAPRVDALFARVEALIHGRERAAAALDRAREVRRALAEVHARAIEASLAIGQEVEVGDPARALPDPVDEGRIAGLDAWLRKLEAVVDAGRWAPAEVGLGRWIEAAEQYAAADRLVVERARALLSLRGELAGRLSARRAQAMTLTARGVEMAPTTEALALEADRLLRMRPTPIEAAARMLERYEAEIVSLATLHATRAP